MRLVNLFIENFFFILGLFCFFLGVIIAPLTIFNSDFDSSKKRAKDSCLSIFGGLIFLMGSFCFFDIIGSLDASLSDARSNFWIFIQGLFTLALILSSSIYLYDTGRLYFDLNKTNDEFCEYLNNPRGLVIKQIIVIILSLFFFWRMILILSGKLFPF